MTPTTVTIWRLFQLAYEREKNRHESDDRARLAAIRSVEQMRSSYLQSAPTTVKNAKSTRRVAA